MTTDSHEAIAADAIQILFLIGLGKVPMQFLEIQQAADTLAARLETLGLRQ